MRVLITGGRSDIGAAIAAQLAKRGDYLGVTASTPETLATMERRYAESGVAASCHLLNLSSLSAEHLSRLASFPWDGLILNAATALDRVRPFHRQHLEAFDVMLQADVLGNVALIKAVLPGMIERKFGRILLVSSISVVLGTPGFSPYAAAKGALEAIIRSLAAEYGEKGVLANILRLGVIATARNERVRMQDGYLDRVSKMIPQGRVGEPNEVALAVEPFLAEQQFINGSDLTIGGGMPLLSQAQWGS